MKVKDLIEKLSKFDPDVEVALADFQDNCYDKDIFIHGDYYWVDTSGEMICEDDYDDYEWECLFAENELKKIILIS